MLIEDDFAFAGGDGLFQSVLAGVPPRDAGAGSGALQAFQQIGGAVGVALVGAGLGAVTANLLFAATGQDPHFLVLILFTIIGAAICRPCCSAIRPSARASCPPISPSLRVMRQASERQTVRRT